MYKCGNKYYYKSMKNPKTLPQGILEIGRGQRNKQFHGKRYCPTNNTIIFVFK